MMQEPARMWRTTARRRVEEGVAVRISAVVPLCSSISAA